VDTIYRVVKERGPEGPVFFPTIADFARHVAAAAGQSADTELVRQDVRFGGNAPLMGNALACLGMPVTCVGAMGVPRLRDVFASLHPSCRLVSLCDPGDTSAFEFSDGKLMFADLSPLSELNWPRVSRSLEEQGLRSALLQCDLLALVNWGGLVNAQAIWAGIAGELMSAVGPGGVAGNGCRIFVDLSDISKRTTPDLLAMLALLARLARSFEVTLGLNEHELRILHARLAGAARIRPMRAGGLEDLCGDLFSALGLHAVVAHPLDRSLVATAHGVTERPGRLVSSPKLSTGGGDNFNAGYCFGRWIGLAEPLSLDLGMTVSALYVENGRSPTPAEVISRLEVADAG
jgi:sugar/nucleoside kinase (ribokinase family)